jgi:hypothetical protein
MLPWVADPALAYETDQLTWRDLQLADSTAYANQVANELIGVAVAGTNAETACQGTDDELRELLARHVHDATSKRQGVWERGPFRAPGFSRFSAALETSPEVDRFAFSRREDLYGDMTLWQSVILTMAGPCSTFEIAGVRTGSDKFDHFLDTGYHYFAEERRHGDPRAGVERGTQTEREFYGMLTSKAFSYADLRANWDGWRFYEGLLSPGSTVARGDDGCLRVAAPFDWRDWVGPEWDEVLNPPVYTRLVERRVLATLEARRDEVCASRERWDHDRWREDDLATLPPRPDYVAGPAPARRDPWQLEALCNPERTEPLGPSPVRPHHEVHLLRAEARRGPG